MADPCDENPSDIVVVLDDGHADLWNALLPGRHCLIVPEDDGGLTGSTWPARPFAVVIHVNLHADARSWKAAEDSGLSRLGIDLAIRLRQQPGRCDCPIILVTFEQLADLKNGLQTRNDGFIALLDQTAWAHSWLRLPATAETIQAFVAKARHTFDAHLRSERTAEGGDPLAELAKAACATALNKENKRYRHRQGTFCAAVRLLLGGLQDRVVKIDQAESILTKIEKGRNAGASSSTYDFDLVRRYLEAFHPPGTNQQPPAPPVHEQAAESRPTMLVIDDEWESAGWGIVLPALFPDWKVEGCTSYDQLAPATLYRYQLVLLDFLMPESGLAILHKIRSQAPLLPVVLFSGDDSAATYASAIHWGANAFIVKELSDTADRDPVVYYRHFSAAVAEMSSVNRDALSGFTAAWSKIVGLRGSTPAPHIAANFRYIRLEEAISALERAIFFLAYASGLAGTPGWKLQGDTRRSATRAAGLDLGRTLEALCYAHNNDGNTERINVPETILELFRTRRWRGGGTSGSFMRIATKAARCRHELPNWDNASLFRSCKIVADGLHACCSSWEMTFPAASISSPVFTGEKQIPGSRTAEDSHDARSVQGCVRFLIGHCLLNGAAGESGGNLSEYWKLLDKPEDAADLVEMITTSAGLRDNPSASEQQKNLLFIDDSAHSDGWLTALSLCLPGFNILHISEPAALSQQDICELAQAAHVVLLDLRLPGKDGDPPDEKHGISLLETIRASAHSTPIVVFSADKEVRWARRSYALGAQHYFTKSGSPLPSGFEDDRVEFFTDYYREFLGAIHINSPKDSLGDIHSQRDRFSRQGRFRILDSLTDGGRKIKRFLSAADTKDSVSECLASSIERELNLAVSLNWISKDSHAAAIWRYIVRTSDQSQLYESIIRAAALIETIIRIVIAIREPQLGFALLEKMTFDRLREYVATGFNYHRLTATGIVPLLESLSQYRNQLVHHNPTSGMLNIKQQYTLLSSMEHILETLIDETILQGLEIRYGAVEDPKPTPLTTLTVSLSTSLSVEAHLSESRNRFDAEKLAWGKTLYDLRAAMAACDQSSRDAELGKKTILAEQEALEQKRTLSVGAADALTDQIADQWDVPSHVQQKRDQILDEKRRQIEELEDEIARLGDVLSEVNSGREAIASERELLSQEYAKQKSAWWHRERLLREQRDRWKCLRDWLHERRLEERVARKVGETPLPCNWNTRTKEIQSLVEGFFEEHGHQPDIPIDDLSQKLREWAMHEGV